MYAQLGNIKFEGLKGFVSFGHEKGVNFAQHERIDGKPRLQSVGDNLDSISFDIYLHSEFTNPEEDIEALELAMDNKEVLLLLLGNGKIVGDFVITNFSQSNSFTDSVGNLISVTLSVTLLESYTDDKLREAERQKISEAFATQSRNSNVRTVLAPKLSKGMGLTVNISKVDITSSEISKHIETIEENPDQSVTFKDRIIEGLDLIEVYLAKSETILSSAELSALVPDLPSSLVNVYNRVQDLRSVLGVGDISEIKSLGSSLKQAAVIAKSANVKVSNNSIIRRI
jgi:phage protein U